VRSTAPVRGTKDRAKPKGKTGIKRFAVKTDKRNMGFPEQRAGVLSKSKEWGGMDPGAEVAQGAKKKQQLS